MPNELSFAGSHRVAPASGPLRRAASVAAITLLIIAAHVAEPNMARAATYVDQLHDKGQYELKGPWGLGTDDLGNIYVADTRAHRIVKFGPDLDPIAFFGTGPPPFADGHAAEDGFLYYPEAVAFGNNQIYVADTANNRVQVYSTGGHFLFNWGKGGGGDGDLSEPNGIAVHPCTGNVYVTEGRNHRVSVFSPNGNFLFKWGSFGTGNTQFQKPAGIALARTFCLAFVTDHFGGRVLVFNSEGGYISQFGTPGVAEGQLSFPDEIALLPSDAGGHDDVWVVESGSFRVSKWSAVGNTEDFEYKLQFSNGAAALESPHGMASDQQGNLFVTNTDADDPDVYKYSIVPPKLKVFYTSTRSRVENTKGLWFGAFYNQIDQTCRILAKLTVTVPAKERHVLHLEDDPKVASSPKTTDFKVDLTTKQLRWIKQAWDKGRKITIAGKFSGPCTDGVRISKNKEWKR